MVPFERIAVWYKYLQGLVLHYISSAWLREVLGACCRLLPDSVGVTSAVVRLLFALLSNGSRSHADEQPKMPRTCSGAVSNQVRTVAESCRGLRALEGSLRDLKGVLLFKLNFCRIFKHNQ
ncbi:hypothetical protein D3C87_305830 [compost metagenome]